MSFSEETKERLKAIARSVLLTFIVFSLGWWAHADLFGGPAGKNGGGSAGSAANSRRKVVAYYFHGNVRCKSCVDIEQFSEEAIKEGFPGELHDGLLEYKVINVQTPETRHYFDDYSLTSWALVLVDYRDGKQTRWKNLDKVWELVLGNPSKFHDYVKGEVREFLAAEG